MRKWIGLAAIALLAISASAQAATRGDAMPHIAPQWQQDVDIPCGQSQYGGGPYSLDVRPGVGVLVRTDKRLAAYSPQGELRWQASIDCDGVPYLKRERAVLTPDGGAWALLGGEMQRFDAQGQVSATVTLGFNHFIRSVVSQRYSNNFNWLAGSEAISSATMRLSS